MMLYNVLLIMSIVENPESSSEIYFSIEKDKHGIVQVCAGDIHNSHGHGHGGGVINSDAEEAVKQDVIAHTSNNLGNKKLTLQGNDINFYRNHSPLGLILEKNSSFIHSIEVKLSEARNKLTHPEVCIPRSEQDKLKASNFGAKILRIGTWERVSRYEGDLIAKCYYAKKKIVWEILEGALKRKIEIQWSDIIGISATIDDNEPGILEIELNNPPLYFHETNPQPRKHTLWQHASDFTGGQAPNYRRHCIVFPPGILDRHYEKLLQCDQRLLELSQKPFPTLSNPYFHSNIYGLCNVNGFSHQFHCDGPKFLIPGGNHNLAQSFKGTTNSLSFRSVNSNTSHVMPHIQYHAQSFPTLFHHHVHNYQGEPNHILENVDLTSTMLDENATNYHIDDQRTILWSRQEPYSMDMVRSDILYQESYISGEESGIINTTSNGISITEANHLLDDLNSCTELGVNSNTAMCANQLVSQHQCFATNSDDINQYNCETNSLPVMPKPISWLPPLQDLKNDTTPQNQSVYPYVFQKPLQNIAMGQPKLLM